MHSCFLSAILYKLTSLVIVFGEAAVNLSKHEGGTFRLNRSNVSAIPYYEIYI